jgi:hypothetical protein
MTAGRDELEMWRREIEYCDSQLREATSRGWQDYWTLRLLAAQAGMRLYIRAKRKAWGLPVAEWDESAVVTVGAAHLRNVLIHE